MTEVIRNTAAHSTRDALVVAALSACEASEKYAKVKSPVTRSRPRGSARRARTSASRRVRRLAAGRCSSPHGDGRAAWSTGTASAPRRPRRGCAEQRHEAALGPVVQVAGRVAEVPQVGAAGHVQPAPERLARDGDEQGPRGARAPSRRRVCSGSGTCSSTSIAVATSNSPSREGQRSAFMTRYSRFGAWRLPTRPGARGPRGRCRPRARARALRPLFGEHALAAADVEDRLRGGLRRAARRTCARSPPSAA